MFLNGRKLFTFWQIKTVSIQMARLVLPYKYVFLLTILKFNIFLILFQTYTQVKSRFNLIVLNLVITDFITSSVGVFMDNIGSSLGGRKLEPKFCNFEGFSHMTTGSLVSNYLSIFMFNRIVHLIIIFKYLLSYVFFAGMASLYTTVALNFARLHVIRRKDQSWLEHTSISWKNTRSLMFIWILAFSFALPPLIGIGIYDQTMVGAR